MPVEVLHLYVSQQRASESQPGTSPHFNCVHSIFLDVRSSDSKQFGFTHHFSISSSCQNHYNLRAANWWLIKIKVKEYLEIISVSWLSYWQLHVLLHLLGSSCRALHHVISETSNFVELHALSLNSWYTFPLAFQLWLGDEHCPCSHNLAKTDPPRSLRKPGTILEFPALSSIQWISIINTYESEGHVFLTTQFYKIFCLKMFYFLHWFS